MKLELDEAISLVLALPSHRSSNEGQRKFGEKAIDYLYGYKDLGDDTDKAYNRAMICSVLSAVRAFSVERDRINNEWKAISAVKERNLRYLDVIKNLSPFEKDNYWSKIIALIVAAGFTVKFPLSSSNPALGVGVFIGILILLEAISKYCEIEYAKSLEKEEPSDRQKKWESESLVRYRELLQRFMDEAIEIHKRFYPNEKELYGYDLGKEEDIEGLKEYMLKLNMYY